MSYPSWIAPDEKDIENNRATEPEGERLRRELTDWLERNRICGILMDTTHHHVDIAFGPNLPNEIRSKLSIWGSIYVVISNEVDWRAQRESEVQSLFTVEQVRDALIASSPQGFDLSKCGVNEHILVDELNERLPLAAQRESEQP